MATTKRRKQAAADTASQPNTPKQTTPAAEGANLAPALVVPDPAGSASEDTATQTPMQNHEPQSAPLLGAERLDLASNAPAESASLSPASERAIFMRRRMIAIGSVALMIIAVAFLAIRAFAAQTAITPAPAAPAATATPAATTQPVPTATAAPGIAANPTAIAAQAGVVAPGSGIACSEIAGLPVFAGAACTEQDSDHDDGVIKLENTYTTLAAADDVRRFYEGAFIQNGWTLADTDHDADGQSWEYTVTQGQRKIKIKVEGNKGPQDNLTKIKIAED